MKAKNASSHAKRAEDRAFVPERRAEMQTLLKSGKKGLRNIAFDTQGLSQISYLRSKVWLKMIKTRAHSNTLLRIQTSDLQVREYQSITGVPLLGSETLPRGTMIDVVHKTMESASIITPF